MENCITSKPIWGDHYLLGDHFLRGCFAITEELSAWVRGEGQNERFSHTLLNSRLPTDGTIGPCIVHRKPTPKRTLYFYDTLHYPGIDYYKLIRVVAAHVFGRRPTRALLQSLPTWSNIITSQGDRRKMTTVPIIELAPVAAVATHTPKRPRWC